MWVCEHRAVGKVSVVAPPFRSSRKPCWVGGGQGLALCRVVCSTSWKGDWSIQQESKQTGRPSCSCSQASICQKGGLSPNIGAPLNPRSLISNWPPIPGPETRNRL